MYRSPDSVRGTREAMLGVALGRRLPLADRSGGGSRDRQGERGFAAPAGVTVRHFRRQRDRDGGRSDGHRTGMGSEGRRGVEREEGEVGRGVPLSAGLRQSLPLSSWREASGARGGSPVRAFAPSARRAPMSLPGPSKAKLRTVPSGTVKSTMRLGSLARNVRPGEVSVAECL